MATLAPPTAPADGQTTSGSTGGGSKNAVQPNPFTKASRRKTEPFYDKSGITLGASAQQLAPFDVPATGYLRHVVLDVVATGTTGATYNADAPWNVLDQVMLTDVNGQPIDILDGYSLYLANLIGGYAFFGNPAKSSLYSLTTTGFHFQLRIPVEIVMRNALGALANMNAAMTYKVHISLAPAADVYATNSTSNSLRVRALVESWANPASADLRGIPNTPTPPALGTTQNWSLYVTPTTVGQNTIRLPRVGNTIRNLIFVNRDNTGARTDTGRPDPISVYIDGNQWTRQWLDYDTERWYELFGLAAVDIPTGVWAIVLTDDFDGTPGQEIGDFWLPTTGATRLEVQGSWGAAGSLDVITNDILAFAGSGGAGQTLG